MQYFSEGLQQMRYITGRHIFYILEMKKNSYKSISAHFFQRKKIQIIYENNFLWILQKPVSKICT